MGDDLLAEEECELVSSREPVFISVPSDRSAAGNDTAPLGSFP